MDWTQRLRIRQLHVLTELYRSRNMSLTANRLNMTQPALSKWLSELEGDLGVPLFERHAKGLSPTPFSDMLIGHVNAILAEVDRTQQDIDLMAAGATGHLVLGATPSVAASEVVAIAIATVREKYPKVFVTLNEGVLQDIVQQLREGKLDYVIGRMDGRVSCEALTYDALYDDTIRVVAAPDHPLADQPALSWSDTRAYEWVGMPPGSQLRSELDFELAVAAEPAGRICIETAGLLPTFSILRKSQLLGLASLRVAKVFANWGVVSILDLPYASKSGIGLLSRREGSPSPIGQAFREAVIAAAMEKQG